MHTLSVEAAVRAALAEMANRPANSNRIAVALSGGRDSMVLLEAAHRACRELAIDLFAVHVHHGLSPNADAWAEFCARQCERRGMVLALARVEVSRSGGESLEAAARAARYEALARADADAVLLAHHADDQAETVLLQLMRGAGPLGLAGMAARCTRAGMPFVRPLLACPGHALAEYAHEHGLAWIEDESNADIRLRRNALRRQIVPMLRGTFPGYPATLVRAALHQRDSAELLEALADLDAQRLGCSDAALVLDQTGFAALDRTSPARARNVLRWFLRRHGLSLPSAARLHAMVEQCTHARHDARVWLRHEDATLGIHAGGISVHRTARPTPFAVAWRGEASVCLPGGTLQASPGRGHGLAAAAVAQGALTLKPRAGGERLRADAHRPRRSLTALFQAAGTPWWQRDGWPLLWLGETLVAVPGIAVDAAFAAPPDALAYDLRWQPHT